MSGLQAAWFVFTNGGWIAFAGMFIYFLPVFWYEYRNTKYLSTIEYVFLAIDVPADNEQMPKAVEQIFATISGAHSPLLMGEIWWEGKSQLKFSFEIVSIDGYLQFIIRAPKINRDLVESAIYAQYPQAEITEVEDYAKDMPTKYPNDTYTVWGTELALTRPEAYPIRTYIEFEEKLMGEFKDPMAAVLETMNKLRPGEQFWIQIIVSPRDHTWAEKSNKLAAKLAGKKGTSAKKSGPLSPILKFFGDWAQYSNTVTRAEKPEERRKDEMPSLLLHLTPGEKNAIEAIERKASKIAFDCKIRMVYIGRKDVFSAGRVVPAVFGAIKQFSTNDLNGFKPDKYTKTSAYYGFAQRKMDKRRGKIIRYYIARSAWLGGPNYILNTEELATLYHFPINTVKAPLMPRLQMKKSEPPSYLPLGESLANEGSGSALREQLDDLRINNDYYEKRYGLHRDRVQPPSQPEGKSEPAQREAPPNLPLA
ncbi:MAG: hypothetical protein V1846_00585 [Candidatus Komeilibacteria bacterium]